MRKSPRIRRGGGRPISYAHHLPKAIKALEDKNLGMLGWEWVTDHLAVSKGTAIRVLNHAGAHLLGNSLYIEPMRLQKYFELLYDGNPEVMRQSRTAHALAEVAHSVSLRQQVITHRRDVARLEFKTLWETPGLAFTSTRLVIDFKGWEDFLNKLSVVVFALDNDYDKIQTFINEWTRPGRDSPQP